MPRGAPATIAIDRRPGRQMETIAAQTLLVRAPAAPESLMRSIVVIFVPLDETRSGFEAALRKHAEKAQFIDNPPPIQPPPISEPELIPLWKWFTF